MVNLSKVMSEGTDFEAVFDRATTSAERFGQSISSALDAYTEFARQGYKEQELSVLSDASLVASNVGEITSQRASEYLTSSLIQWKKDSSEAMEIVDSWNEISNNYATTTEKLAAGQAKAGATARAMGLDFNQLNGIIGTVTAATKQSGSEIGNFIKSVLPRLVGQPGQDALSSLGISLTDSQGNLRDVVTVYTEVAERVKNISDSERIAVTEGLAGKYHIARMQLFLDDLGSADSMYRQMYDSSVNSAGSAMEENEKFMGSLQARINLARVEIEKLALAMGEAFLTESMITGIKVFGDFLGAATKLIDTVGALPIVLGTVGVGAALLSANFRNLMTSIGLAGASFVKFGIDSASATTASIPPLITQTHATNAMSTAALRASISMERMSVSTAVTSNATRMLSASIASASVSTQTLGARLTVAGATATTAARGFWTASAGIRGMLLSTGLIGVAFIGLGVITEALMSKMQKQRELQEKIESENRKLAESYSQNSEKITKLASKYADLQSAINDGKIDNASMSEYVKTQNELAELLPTLKKGETEHGNAILGNASVIQQRIDLIKTQAEAQERLNAATEYENQSAAYDEAIKSAEEAQRKLDSFNFKNTPTINDRGNTATPDYLDVGKVKDIDSLNAAIETLSKNKAKMQEEDAEGNRLWINAIEGQLEYYRNQKQEYINLQTGIEIANGQILSSALKKNDTILNSNEDLSKSSKTLADSIATTAASFVGDTDTLVSFFEDFHNTLEDSNATKSLEEYGNSFEILKRKQREGLSTEELKKYSLNTKKILDEVKEQFLKVAETNGIQGQELKQLEALFSSSSTGVDTFSLSVEELGAKLGMSTEETLNFLKAAQDMDGSIADLGEALGGANSKIAEYVAKLRELTTTEEQMVGVSRNQLNAVDDLVYMYQALSTQTDLTADQTLALKNAEETLMKIYPELSKFGMLRIDSIIAEKEAQEILLTSVELAKKGKLTAEEEMTLSSALGAKARIDNIKKEMEAMLVLFNQYMDNAQKIADASKDFNGDMDAEEAYIKAIKARNFEMNQTPYKEKAAELDGYIDSLNTSTGILKNSAGYQDAQSKSTDKSTKSTKEATYITDKYKQAIEAVNLEIEKQQKLRSNMTDFSKQYRDSLQTEINLEKQKSKLMEDQAASLQSQIKSGKVIQTGKSSSSSNQKLNGWSGNITSNYGTRKDPFTGKATRHDGVDIAGSKGQRLDSNVNGKVVFAGKGTGSSAGLGNYVTIQAEDGMKHIYAHLDKVVATLGQTISTGMQIGNIGSTGRSTNPHLHYQTKNASGKNVDPTSYMQSAKGGGDLASGASNAQQAIDQAKSDLNGLQSNIMQSQEKIAKLELDIINSQISEFDNTRQLYQHTLDYEDAKQQAISQTGKEYRASIDKQITALNGQQTANQAELKFLDNLIANGKLSSIAMHEMKEKVKALKVEMLQLGSAIEDANFEKITSRMAAFDESQDDLQYIVDLTGEYMGTLTEGSEEYNKAAKEQIAAMQKQQRMLRTQIDEHKNDLATKKLGVQETKDLKEKIEDLAIAYYSLGNGIKSTTESLVEANKRMAEEVADKLINSYKDYHSERRDAHMKTLDAEAKAEDKRHKQISDNLSKELDAYKKIIQAKLDMLDKEESERDYNKEIDDLEKTRLETLDKINLLSMDDSFEARKEVASLTEKLNATEEQIAEKRHDREVELRKENLNDLLESKEEDVKNRQELEDQRYEHEKELIDKQKEYWEQYYNDLINDERKFAKMRKDIVAGNTSEINAEFGKILDYFNETMPELENTLDGTMQAVGTSIRQNMIDNLKEALDLMSQLGKNPPSTGGSSNQFESDKNNANPPSPPPSSGGDSGGKKGTITVTKPINLWERERGSDKMKMVRILQPGEKYNVYGDETRSSFGKQYDVGANKWITDMPGYIKYAAFEKGGFTGKQEGWAQLHPEEFVLNKGMTKEAMKMSDLFANLNRLINPLNMNRIQPPQLAGSTGSGDIHLEFHIDKMIANEKEADSFSKRIGDNLKRLKGLK